MKGNKSKLGTKNGSSSVSTKTRNVGARNKYYRGCSFPGKELAHDGQPQNDDDTPDKLVTPKTETETDNPASKINSVFYLEESPPPPACAVSSSCNHQKGDEYSTDKAYDSSDKLPRNKPISYQICIESEDGISLVVDLNSTPSDLAQSYSAVHADENPFLTPATEQEIVDDIPPGERLTRVGDIHEADIMGDKPVEQVEMEELAGSGVKVTDPCRQLVVKDVKSGDDVLENWSAEGNFDHTSSQPLFVASAPHIDPVINNNGGLEGQNEVSEKLVCLHPIKVSDKPGGITEKKIDQIYDLLQSIQKRQDDAIHKKCLLEEQNAQCDMDIQIMLSEGKITPKVMSIMEKYKDTRSNTIEVVNSSPSREGGQALSRKRKRMKEATLLHNPCQELNKICRGNNWILPRYTILPSVEAGMFHARVRLTGLDFDMSIDGDLHMTPREARCSAAANMIFELYKKARE